MLSLVCFSHSLTLLMFPPFLCSNLTSSVVLPIRAPPVYVTVSIQACLVGALQLQCETWLSASLLNSCHENQTDTVNWCSRLKETGLKYLHNFTEDWRKLLKHVSRGPGCCNPTRQGRVALGCHPEPMVPRGNDGGVGSRATVEKRGEQWKGHAGWSY